ncbi:MAG: 60S ribosomal export protein NMD3 [Candidatus Thermoplasmatota archaeon]|nr:60S ribosomal export protein NMD3 [Candidatus Thermoplasmatota archaeon]
MLCLKCGQREQFADNLCEECFRASVQPISLPPVIHGNVCRTCFRLQKGRSWLEIEASIEDAAVHLAKLNIGISGDAQNPRVELSVDLQDSSVFRISGKASSVFKGVIVEQTLSTEVRFHLQSCPFCSRQRGNYFEAVIQLRGLDTLTERQIDELLQRIRDEVYSTSLKDPRTFISNEVKVRGGHDLYMGENSHARQLAQKLHDEYGGEFKWSSSLYGNKDGRDIYRHTYLVRLPGFVVGDYLVKESNAYLVTKVFKRVQLKELSTRRDITVDLQDAMSMRIFKAEHVEVELVVIMQTDKEVQLLHPTTMRPVDLLKPEPVTFGEKARCVYIEDELYLV